MPEVISFLSTRRSVTAKSMAVGKVDPAHLDAILNAGIRVPDHPVAQHVLRELGSPLIVSSVHDEDAMREYTTDPELILERNSHLVDLVVDGGMGKLEASTVLDCTGSEPEVLREGLGPVDDLF